MTTCTRLYGKLPHEFEHAEEMFDSWKDLRNYLFELEEKQLYSGHVFRGHSIEGWRLEPTLNRIIDKPIPTLFEKWHVGAEEQSIRRFQLACHHYMAKDLLPQDEGRHVEWFSLMQHYGTPTRLLDVSASPFVAAFFALTDITSKSELSCIWAISLAEIDEQNTQRFGIKSEDKYSSLPKRYEELPFGDNEERHVVAYYYPERPSPRPFSQKGGFIYALDNDHDLERTLSTYDYTTSIATKIYVKRNRQVIVDSLKDFKIMNISFSSLFGGLDGYAKDVATDLFIINS